MSIQVLKEELINQIAAGEVVERPAHLVKELVENAIDAGSTSISIDYGQGGRFVKIKDNGSGMTKEDLELSVHRHATSKITDSEDLWKISSFGFRGEALASISSVCEFDITSGQGDSAYRLTVNFGQKSATKEAAPMQGTVITIEKLFENLPARLKFLKSNAAEHTQIKNALKSLALPNHQIHFRIRQEDKLIADWPAVAGFQQRVAQVIEVDPERIYIYQAEDSFGFKSELALLPPNEVARNLRQLTTFVRGRAVQDRTLQQAVIEAYRGALMHGEYPIAVVKLDCPAEEVDVNVHPTKTQVKFRQSQSAFKVIYKAARKFVEEAPWIESVAKPSVQPSVPSPQPTGFQLQPSMSTMSFQTNSISTTDVGVRESLQTVAAIPVERPMQQTVTQQTSGWSGLRVLAQAHQTYLICQAEEGLVFVDQHAAHERVLFESLNKAWRESKLLDIQSLLIPLTIDLTEDAIEALSLHFDNFKKIGVEVEKVGPQSVAVNSYPAVLKESGIMKMLPKAADEIMQQGESFAFEHLLDDVFATMACHSAVRAGQTLTAEQMEKLIEQMDEFRESSFCPHGRPVFVEMKLPEIERRFGRIT